MAISFPANPINGQRYQAAGRTYVYSTSGDLWRDDTVVGTGANATSITAYATIDDLPLTNVADGSQALILSTNRLYIWNNTGWYQIALINSAPNITIVEDANGNSTPFALSNNGTPTIITITASDPDGIPLTYDFTTSGMASTATVSRNDNVFTVTPSELVQDEGTFDITFTASDGINISGSIATFTLSFAVIVPDSRYTTTLITAGTNAGGNTSIIDRSTSSHTLTASSETYLTSLSPYRHGGYSVGFDGIDDYFAFDHEALGAGDWTIEFWAYFNSTSNNAYIFDFRSGNTNHPALNLQGGNWTYGSGSSYLINSGVAPTTGVWYHVALVKNSGTTNLYVGGTSIGSYSDSITYESNPAAQIGAFRERTTAWFNGYIRDFRIVSGTAVYTSSFTPPNEPLGNITDTQLLACALPYFADASSNNLTLTPTSDLIVLPFSPYDNVSYSVFNHGGSVYFDGASTRIQVNSSTDFAFGTGDFTIEGWYNIPSHGSDNYLFDIGSNNLYLHISSNLLAYHNGIAHTSTDTFVDIAPLNEWNHIAVVRNSGITNVYVNGKVVNGLDNLSDTTNWASSATVTLMDYGPGSAGVETPGYVSDFRITTSAVYTSEFTPPIFPVGNNIDSVLYLATNTANIIEKSQTVNVKLLNGVVASDAVTKFSANSIEFDGTDDAIDILANFGFEFGTEDFTIELWINANAMDNDPWIFDLTNSSRSAAEIGWYCRLQDSGRFVFGWGDSSSSQYIESSSGTAITTSTWNHIACVRQSGQLYIYVNGVETTSIRTGSGDDHDFQSSMTIGKNKVNSLNNLNGYIEDFRITKGLARYTGSFTPPTASLEG